MKSDPSSECVMVAIVFEASSTHKLFSLSFLVHII